MATNKKKELTRVDKLKLELKQAIDIEKNNVRFSKMSASKKRVIVAEDVILSLRANLFEANTGDYFNLNLNREAGTSQLQDVLCNKDKVESCTVCAMGAIFASKVKLSNSFTISKNDWYISANAAEIIDNLDGIFSKDQLRLIECAFEGGFQATGLSQDEEERIENICYTKYYSKYRDSKSRMIAIMKNIIKNKGIFKP